jgi:sugar phosphate isomerase/epimerase
MSLKLGAATYACFWQLPLEDTIRRVRDIGFRYAPTNAGIREEELRQLEDTVGLAADLGARMVVVSFGQRPAHLPGASRALAYRQGGAPAKSRPVRPSGRRPGAGKRLDSSLPRQQLVRLAKEPSHPWLHIVNDAANASMEATYPQDSDAVLRESTNGLAALGWER